MAGFGRHLSAALVAIAMIAAQMMPAWAGCHSQRHTAAMAMTDAVKVDQPAHHGMSHAAQPKADVSLTAADPVQPSPSDVCLGNCGCACGVSGAFVLSAVAAIDAPHGVALNPDFASAELPLGDRPDGPRRPPRTTA